MTAAVCDGAKEWSGGTRVLAVIARAHCVLLNREIYFAKLKESKKNVSVQTFSTAVTDYQIQCRNMVPKQLNRGHQYRVIVLYSAVQKYGIYSHGRQREEMLHTFAAV